jgi:tetratricopeptide (TPR) repeat protein
MHDYDRAIADLSEASMCTNGPLGPVPGGVDAGVPVAISTGKSLPFRVDIPLRDVFIERGGAYLSKGDLALARDDAEHALRLDPRSDRAFVLRGRVHKACGNDADARADMGKALELTKDPDVRIEAEAMLRERDGT